MIKTVRQACRLNPIIRDYRMSQGIENLAELINDQGDGREFFSRNYVTHGMEQLFREGLLRLSGKSDQAVFELGIPGARWRSRAPARTSGAVWSPPTRRWPSTCQTTACSA